MDEEEFVGGFFGGVCKDLDRVGGGLLLFRVNGRREVRM